uniref:Molybdopterin synthase sulfur carrier subunit n=1 Tax=Setaria digitata TaxID=48799 RepID=A0A915PLL7_9BILA
MVPVHLVLFGKARELLSNASERNLNVPRVLKCQQLRQLIFHEMIQELSSIEKSCMLALNQEYIGNHNDEITISAHSEIAVIPPISGG